jgi:restriction system protein
VQDASRFEKAVFNWFARRSDRVALATPLIVFSAIAVSGLVVLSTAYGLPAGFIGWAFALAMAAGVTLYLSMIFAVGAMFTRTTRFRLLQLHKTMRDIQAMSWREFEDLVVAYYDAHGYETEHLGRDSADGGVDIRIRKAGETWLVQCKHYRSQWIEERPLRELLGVVASQRASGGVFIACGAFDDRALAFSKANPNLQLIGGEQLRDLVNDIVRGKEIDSVKSCPICGGRMRSANGRYGPFLGCANFPACRGWRPIQSESPATG